MDLTSTLQIATITITLLLGLISYYQTKKIQHGQNIISVTTKYRSERSEQLKEAGAALLSNTSPRLLEMSKDAVSLLKEATCASEKIGMILHRNFKADKDLIELADEILQTATAYANERREDTLRRLLYLQEIFRLKCDLYAGADWNRIKQETKGENTSSQSWIDYYADLEKSFAPEFERIKEKYGQK